MSSPPRIEFTPSWKEELVCRFEDHDFVVEITMGVLTVYFPGRNLWNATAPAWAKDLWDEIVEALSKWCHEQKIPLEISESAWVNF